MGNLPEEIVKKIDKTEMTRGAQPPERVPYQNRVRRWNRAVVPLRFKGIIPPKGYENGHVLLIRPEEYFDPSTKARRKNLPSDVQIGRNAFVYYDNRKDWIAYPPDKEGWKPCSLASDGKALEKRVGKGKDEGEYLARVPATTTSGEEGEKVVHGVPQGIRFFEYASRETSWNVALQLAYLAWKTEGIGEVSDGPMPEVLELAVQHLGLGDEERLQELRSMRAGKASCPLCLNSVQASELMEKVEQTPGREVVDLTITPANLFHLEPIRPGEFNHVPYKVGWGHHHCNAASRDMSIEEALDWMETILRNSGRIQGPGG